MTSRPPLPDDIASVDDLVFWVKLDRGAQYLTLACAVFLVWEWFNTIEIEVRYLWFRGPWLSPTKILFYINRYLTLAAFITRAVVVLDPRPTPMICNGVLPFSAYSSVVITISVEIILMLRVWAIYSRSRTIGMLLAFVIVAGVLASVAVYFIPFPHLTLLATTAPSSLHPCPNSPSILFFLLFLIAAFVEITFFCLLCRQTLALSLGSQTPIITALMVHGAAYFLVAFLSFGFTALAQLSQVLAQPVQYSNFAVVFASAASTRMILSLRLVNTSTIYVNIELTPRSRPTATSGTQAALETGAVFAKPPFSTMDTELTTYDGR